MAAGARRLPGVLKAMAASSVGEAAPAPSTFRIPRPPAPRLRAFPGPLQPPLLVTASAVEGDSYALGFLAGGLSDGSGAVWNQLRMISSEGKAEDAMVTWLEKHTGVVCGLSRFRG